MVIDAILIKKVDLSLEIFELRCGNCGKLLARVKSLSNFPDLLIEIKCPRCKSLNSIGAPRSAYLNRREEVSAPEIKLL